MEDNKNNPGMQTTITPFLVVDDGLRALEFYKSGFGAEEVARYDMAGGRLMARISINGAEFWMGDEERNLPILSPRTIGGSPVRLILTVADPDTLFAQALKAEATPICPVRDRRILENWEVGRPFRPYLGNRIPL